MKRKGLGNAVTGMGLCIVGGKSCRYAWKIPMVNGRVHCAYIGMEGPYVDWKSRHTVNGHGRTLW